MRVGALWNRTAGRRRWEILYEDIVSCWMRLAV